jgi:hypothetical protein
MNNNGYQKYNNNYNNNYYGGKKNNYNKSKNDVYVKKSDKIEKTDEEGFLGAPSTWFNDEEFFSKLPSSKDKGEKDYYFNSYSSFYIHEEMIKDRVNF